MISDKQFSFLHTFSFSVILPFECRSSVDFSLSLHHGRRTLQGTYTANPLWWILEAHSDSAFIGRLIQTHFWHVLSIQCSSTYTHKLRITFIDGMCDFRYLQDFLSPGRRCWEWHARVLSSAFIFCVGVLSYSATHLCQACFGCVWPRSAPSTRAVKSKKYFHDLFCNCALGFHGKIITYEI